MVRIPTCYTEEAIEVRALNVTMPPIARLMMESDAVTPENVRTVLDVATRQLHSDPAKTSEAA
jgi:hypothetical protein